MTVTAAGDEPARPAAATADRTADGTPDRAADAAAGRTADQAVDRAVEAVWRIESPRLIAGLTRITHDLDVAEELAQDALVAGLEQWPV